MTHLTTDELVDAIDGVLDPARRSHLDTCAPCREQLTDLGQVLADAHAVAVPEPSPLFWQHLSSRVRQAVAAEPAAAGGWRDWLRWPVLAPLAALTLIVMALAIALPRPVPATGPGRSAQVDTDTTLPDSFAIVAELVGDLDWDTAASAGLTITPGAADRAVLDLTASEQQELTRLLQAELTRAKS